VFIKGFKLIIKSFFNLLSPLKKILKFLLFFLYKYLILNIYRLSYYLRKVKNFIFPSEKIRLISLFINKYIYHLVIILLASLISIANILTPETKAENFGEKSILFALATGSNFEDEYIEETLEAMPATTSYLDSESPAVSGTPHVSYETGEEEGELPTTEEGSAILKPEFTTMDASKKFRDKPIEYTVQTGDTISSIAQNFTITTETILWANNLTKFSYIQPGQKLVILPVSGLSHKVVKGDTIGKIATKYKAAKDKIIEFNKLASESDIQTDQILIIPEGQPYYAPIPVQPKLASIKQIFNPSHVEVPSGDKMAWPTTARRISQYFSWRHIGLDIDGNFGDPIWAADDGIVIKSVCMKTGYGCHVIIDHGGGKTTLYGHFQKLYVKEGQRVVRGDVLGEMGSTGRSTGSHLHFEVRFGGKRYNPLSYIR
jgi:murein DD-endopeptidase MepM/ murein hydrolase activator NlpD